MNPLSKIVSQLPRPRGMQPLPAPTYSPQNRPCGNGGRLALAVESMRHHMTDEGWQIMLALQHAGYELWGFNLPNGDTDVRRILEQRPETDVVVVQDKREWDVAQGDWREYRARFTHVEALAERPDIFKLTILKDAHHRPIYHRRGAIEMGCHAWIIYYHPQIVAHLAPYVRPQHLIRTYHSIDPNALPPFRLGRRRKPAILTGAISRHYPLRKRLYGSTELANLVDFQHHPGYHRRGCLTPSYLHKLSHYKVSICTCSRYGYALRKIIESTAVGCRVITDLPPEDRLPGIDENLIRIPTDATPAQVRGAVRQALADYYTDRQYHYARLAVRHYNYRYLGIQLSLAIDRLRINYHASVPSTASCKPQPENIFA